MKFEKIFQAIYNLKKPKYNDNLLCIKNININILVKITSVYGY